MILGYGVMVTLQILVLSFLVRVRVSQLRLLKMVLIEFIGIWCNGNTTDSGPVIPGSSPGIPTREHLSFERCFFFVYTPEQKEKHTSLLRISNPQSPNRLGHFFTPDFKSGGTPSGLAFLNTIKPRAFALGSYDFDDFNDFNEIDYLFSASIALIFSFTSFKSSFSFSTLRFISSTRLLPFLLAAFRKPRLFS